MVNKVKVTRVVKNIGQEELAKKVGVTRQAIHSIENGKYQPSVILAFKIAKALDIDINELFILEDND